VSRPAVKVQRSQPLRLAADRRAPRWETWTAWATAQRRPLAVDLFCGGGGLSLGLEEAGFRVALAIDHDHWAVETHAANMQGLALEMDLSSSENEDKLIEVLGTADIALIAGGPPCQPFSRAGRSAIRFLVDQGKREAVDTRKDLWQVWLRIVRAVRPRAVMLENVPDMALGDDLRVVRAILGALEEDGYETSVDIVEAPDFGVPQHRQRVILVALRDAEVFRWPAPKERVSIWEAISDLPKLGEGVGETELAYRRPETIFQLRARQNIRPGDEHIIYDHVTRAVRDDDREAFRLMGSNTRYSDLPLELRRYRADTFDDKYKRHGKDELARSITAHIAKDGYWYIHPVEDRTLTVREAARLQTFPDWYRFAGTRTHAWRQIGNAVPPFLAEGVGRALMAAMKPKRSTSARARDARRTADIPVGDRRAARSHLDDWAKKDAVVAPWRHPADVWTGLMSSVLGNGKVDAGTMSLLLWHFPTPLELTPEKLATLSTQPGARSGLTRLLPAAEAWRAAQLPGAAAEEEPWWAKIRLSPAEMDRFALLAMGADGLLVTQAPLRVAARVTGRPVDKIDRLTDGRLALASIVGSGPSAGRRMAAVAALGASVCTLNDPGCGHCPLVGICRKAAGDLGSLTEARS
jgi:DNA (cytosine-5)-methyltransferase 1